MNLVYITEARYAAAYQICLEFNDGLKGVIDLDDQLDGEVFEPLQDLEFFKAFVLDSWTLTWENGADFAPKFLHDLLLKSQLRKLPKPNEILLVLGSH